MHAAAFKTFCAVREEFRSLVAAWSAEHSYLRGLQDRLRMELGYDDYEVETPIVYNEALDEVAPTDRIRCVLVADNPGKNEQKAANRRYLVGQSGKLAESWFRRELGVDFRAEVLILNKTPIHTAKTAELRRLVNLARPGETALESLLVESQTAMARLAWRLHLALNEGSGARPVPLWVSGCGELRRGGLFQTYRDELAALARSSPQREREMLWAFNHFSMNQFAIEIKRKSDPRLGTWENLRSIGSANRERIFGPAS
ncbi:MAG TPA: hypothetical protein VMC79_02265 [Rectinemataceae bacterium]|nr:hypothetical protein [Rectinemataceae bacterium]